MKRPLAVTVLAPCLNEELNVAPLVDRVLHTFQEHGIDGEVLLVDDGSSDGTWGRIEQLVQAHGPDGPVQGVRHDQNLGIEQAWRSGISQARSDLVCLIDADLQNRPEDIPRLLGAYRDAQPDLVQGVRIPSERFRRAVFSRVLNWVLNRAFGSDLRDGKSGFLLGRRETLMLILSHRGQYRYFQSFVGAAAVSRGLRIREVDTVFEPRHAGHSFLSSFPVAVSLRILWEMIRFRREARSLRKDGNDRPANA